MNAFRLAVVGKGGAGKSVVAGTLARSLARAGHRVLALDSDPIPGLAASLGVRVGDDALLDGYAEQDEDGAWRLVDGRSADEVVERTALRGPDGVRFLQFGKTATSTLRPLRSSLQAFWAVSHQLAAGEWTVVHDLPAGTRQAYAGWAGPAGSYLVVVEPSMKSVLSARRLSGLTEVDGARVAVVGNKIAVSEDEAVIRAALPGVPLLGLVPRDPELKRAEEAGVAPMDAVPGGPAVQAISALVEPVASWAEAASNVGEAQ